MIWDCGRVKTYHIAQDPAAADDGISSRYILVFFLFNSDDVVAIERVMAIKLTLFNDDFSQVFAEPAAAIPIGDGARLRSGRSFLIIS